MGRTPTDRALVEELAHEIIGDLAPEELDLFDDLSAEYFANPKPPDMSAKTGDDALGFGIGDMLIASTPAAAAMVSVVVAFATQVIVQAASDEASDTIREKVKALFRRGKGPAPVRLSPDQLRQMRAAAEAEAKRFGLSESDAQAMADALFRRMVLGD